MKLEKVASPDSTPNLPIQVSLEEDLPILTLNPRCQELPQLHGEAVTVQLVQLLQVPSVQLLELVPLGHPAAIWGRNCKPK